MLEDLHWADDPTLDLLDAVLRRREPARLLVLGTYRPAGPDLPEPAHRHARARALGARALHPSSRSRGSTSAAVAAHLAARFPGGPLPDGLAAVLTRRSGGNPLFMTNLLDHWLAEGALSETGGAAAARRADPAALEAGVPPTLRAHLEDQLARLDADDAAVLQAASVAGRTFAVETLAAALERAPEAVATALRRARPATRG